MKQFNRNTFSKVSMFLAFVTLAILGCNKDEPANDDSNTEEPGAIQGTPGNPRFNLQFTNGSEADLDLYVQTPDGSVIYFGNPQSQNGNLDVDCLCGDCPNGPNENIFWTPGTAPKGTYKVWVEYFGACGGNNASSNYTLRVMNNSAILQTYSGTLNPAQTTSPVYTYNYQ